MKALIVTLWNKHNKNQSKFNPLSQQRQRPSNQDFDDGHLETVLKTHLQRSFFQANPYQALDLDRGLVIWDLGLQK